MSKFNFNITKKLSGTLARVGEIHTPHGVIHTPSFVTVGTKATVKALTPEQVADLGAQVVLANTYHLYLEPGDAIVAKHGGFPKMMNWAGPTMTDSGGFQVFSLGAAMGKGVTKVATEEAIENYIPEAPDVADENGGLGKLATIDEDGVTFKSYKDGSIHRFTPERSMEIQWNLGADMIFAFDECTSPMAPYEYQKQAMDRTHRWALRSLTRHNELDGEKVQALLGVVQGGRFEDLRAESARVLAEMKTDKGDMFDGFGIGGSFTKKDLGNTLQIVNAILPEDKPRHLLGIGEPIDFFLGVENGCDTFDCVAPTRIARNGGLHTKQGKINIKNAEHRESLDAIEPDCGCYTCKSYTRSYLSHLFRSDEMLAGTLASIHNLYFINKLVEDIRQSLINENFYEFKEQFLKDYYKEKAL
jgi:queuine tRNA-ribosyltransferase